MLGPKIYPLNNIRPGQIEVVSVDVKTANWVRCDNVTVAKEVAKFLKIPVKRVTLTPWSWTTDVPQDNYLAFVQEDHERCECDAGEGRQLQEQGFRKVNSAKAREGMTIPGMSNVGVMTVTQYKAMEAAWHALRASVTYQLHGPGHPGPTCLTDFIRQQDGVSSTTECQDLCTQDPLCKFAAFNLAIRGEGRCGLYKSVCTGMAETACGDVKCYRTFAKIPVSQPSPAPAAPISKTSLRSGSDARGGLTTTTTTPPPARIQMLTRDPCLVTMLRLHTEYFHRHLAHLLDVPEEKLILDTPAVRGTVGLLQLDSSLNVAKKARKLPVLAVQQCSDNELHQRERGLLGLISQRNMTQYASNITAPLVYQVAHDNVSNISNATNATAGPNVTNQRVFLAMHLTNVDYDLLAESWSLVSSFTALVKMAIGASGHVPPGAIKTVYYPGSVVVEATIIPPPGTAATAILAFVNGTVCNETTNRLNGMVSLQAATTGVINCSQTELKLLDPPFKPEEKNRAWVAFWSVVVHEPFADKVAWKLLNEMNDPKSDITKLLPLTLARVPGWKYRSLKEPHAANETRLPPPLDKAVGFALPEPINEEEALKAEMRRMRMERASADALTQAKFTAEDLKITQAVNEAKMAKALLRHTQAKIIRAAKAHTNALFAPNATAGPDIVPYDVIMEDAPDAESPYPWADQNNVS
jgi:hypothetical protein